MKSSRRMPFSPGKIAVLFVHIHLKSEWGSSLIWLLLLGRSLLDEGGVDRLVSITRLKQRYSSRVVKFASQVLAALWVHQELRDAYKKTGWKVSSHLQIDSMSVTLTKRCACWQQESDFVSRGSSAVTGSGSAGAGMSGGGGASSPSHSAANSTLNRPMSSQGGTRYEDKTLSLQRTNNASSINTNNNGQASRQQSYRVSHSVPLLLVAIC